MSQCRTSRCPVYHRSLSTSSITIKFLGQKEPLRVARTYQKSRKGWWRPRSSSRAILPLSTPQSLTSRHAPMKCHVLNEEVSSHRSSINPNLRLKRLLKAWFLLKKPLVQTESGTLLLELLPSTVTIRARIWRCIIPHHNHINQAS